MSVCLLPVVPEALAERAGFAAIVKHVVGNLEGHAESPAVFRHRALGARASAPAAIAPSAPAASNSLAVLASMTCI